MNTGPRGLLGRAGKEKVKVAEPTFIFCGLSFAF